MRIVSLLAWLVATAPAFSAGLNFEGVALTPGAIVQVSVPLSPQEKTYVSEGGNVAPPYTIATISVPPGFDPKKPWPVLVCFSTSDAHRQNRDSLKYSYRKTALAEGWVLIAGDGPGEAPRVDSTGWRTGHTLAALDALHRSFPGSTQWPIATAGHSGGSKRSSYIAPLLALAGNHVIGVFASGITQEGLAKQQPPSDPSVTNYFNPQTTSVCCESIGEGYRRFHPGTGFLRTPYFISTGRLDTIASVDQQMIVEQAARTSGFTNVRHRIHPGGHIVYQPHVQEALRWFRTGK
jgi:hypothetical protein